MSVIFIGTDCFLSDTQFDAELELGNTYVSDKGAVDIYGTSVDCNGVGVRPALKLGY